MGTLAAAAAAEGAAVVTTEEEEDEDRGRATAEVALATVPLAEILTAAT